MKKLYAFAILFTATIGFSQNVTNSTESTQEIQAIPAGYYNAATGTGYALKTQLHNIIKNHTDNGYGGLWGIYTQTAFRDNYYENDGSLLDIYSEKPSGPDNYQYTSTSQQCGNYSGEGQCYNREHLIAQSYFNEASPMKNDPFHVVATDGSVNGARGNFPFGVVGTANYTSSNGSKRGSNLVNSFSNFSGTVFEPIDEFKGDVARTFFYFATCYQDKMAGFYTASNVASTQVKAMFDGSADKVFSDGFILLMIKWHKQDPVSAKEIAQNDAIYTYQGNRNPFIDNPGYVCQIWSAQCATVDSLLSTPSFDFASVAVYPNPSNNHRINIDTEVVLDEIELININGQLMQQIKNPSSTGNTYSLENLPSGFYFLKLTSENQSTTQKVIIN